MMELYDPTLEALVTALLEAFGVTPEGGYIDQLRQLQLAIVNALASEAGLTPEQEQALRQALSYLDAKAGDAELDALDVLRRCLSAVDKELFKWDSSMIQFPGPSGEAQTALTEASPILDHLRPV